jgi:mono/diheme cytochrome c family protein
MPGPFVEVVMAEENRPGTSKVGKIAAIAAAVLIPAVLTYLFWRTTPAVGGWAPEPGAVQAPARPPDLAKGPGSQQQPEQPPELLARQHCAVCHGANLEGTAKAPALRRSHWPYAQNRGLLIQIIHQGRGLTMPGFEGKLSNQQIESLADYLQKANGIQ